MSKIKGTVFLCNTCDPCVVFFVNNKDLVMQKTLIVLGVLLLIAGIIWPWLAKLPLGRLPGDIVIDKPNFKLVFPVITMLILSALLTLILWLFKR